MSIPENTPLLTALRRRQLLNTLRNLAGFAVARMREAQLQEVASSMTLTTLLSLVPLLAVSLAAFAAFPSFSETRAALEEAVMSVLPLSYSEVIMKYLKVFSDHASGLGAFGLAGLALTALLMIDKFFVTVNRIFRVRRMRSWAQRAMIYWALLTLGPIAIALSITLSTQAIRIAAGAAGTGGLPGWLFALIQIILQTIGYAILFKLVPNCRVPFTHALTGGAAVALAGQVFREAFEYYITAGTLSSIYGAFVAFPVFLLWFYIAWMLVFAGAAITATLPQLTSGRFTDSYKLGNDFLTGLALLRKLTSARASGSPCVSELALSRAVDSYPQGIERILVKLSEKGYCAPVVLDEKRRETGWALLCDPEKKTLADAFAVLLIDPCNGLVQPAQPNVNKPEGPLFAWYREFLRDPMIDRPVAELIERLPVTDEKMPTVPRGHEPVLLADGRSSESRSA